MAVEVVATVVGGDMSLANSECSVCGLLPLLVAMRHWPVSSKCGAGQPVLTRGQCWMSGWMSGECVTALWNPGVPVTRLRVC